ncbi:hypothetical protein JOQ06_019098 [Pogonophryne albipinna]|nr:hypothetical protein JOQ06_019098 [Pogonophryne albipinna]
MSKVVTEHIVEEIGDSFYTVKMDGTRDPTGCENISIVLRFVDENYVIKERLLTIATAVAGVAKTLTQTLIDEIRKAALSTDKILSQVYDGASLMSGRHGGVQRLLQDELGREIPYVHCFNHQLHLVVVHAMSGERAIEDLFNICNVLYKFTRKPTVAAHYQGNTLKRLLEQRWTGHLATVQIILKSFQDIVELLRHVENSASFPADLRMEAAGLLSRILKPSFKFHTQIICKILSLLEPANRMMQSEEMDLQTAVQLVNTAKECVEALRTEKVFTEMWSECAQERADDTIHPGPTKRRRTLNTTLEDYVVEETVGVGTQENHQMTEKRRLFYSCIDAVTGEIARRFGERNSAFMEAIASLNPESSFFLEPEKVEPLLKLTGTTLVDAEFIVAKKLILKHVDSITPPEDGKWTLKNILGHLHTTLEAMPSVLTAFKLY